MWYKVQTPDGFHYTPFAKGGYDHIFLGDGSKKPTPKQRAEFLDNNQEYFYEGGVFKVYNVEKLKGESVDSIPPGIYEHCHKDDEWKERLEPFTVREDKLIDLDNSYSEIKSDVETFLENKQYYLDSSLFYKLGLLMYGSAGQGKTARIRTLIKDIFSDKGIVIFVNNKLPTNGFLNSIKDSLKDSLKIFIFEELAANVDDRSIENLLAFLDGELSCENAIIIGITNYPERLPANVAARPGRFDRLYEFKNPDAKERKKLLEFFLKEPPTLDQIELTKDLSVASIKEVCLRTKVNKTTFTQAVKELKQRMELVKKAFAKAESEYGFGFSSRRLDLDDY